MTKRSTLAITVGDPAGIGPEITLRCLVDPAIQQATHAVAYGDPAILARAAEAIGLNVRLNVIANPRDGDDQPPEPGVIDVHDIGVIAKADDIKWGVVQALAGKAAVAAIEQATHDAQSGAVDGIVTAPINKEAVWATGSKFLGHTEMIADLCHAEFADTMFVVDDLCVFFATRHMSLAEAVASIKCELIDPQVRRALTALSVYGHDKPRLAVAALNPHGGEGGHFGREEIDEIAPAIAAVNEDISAGRIVAAPVAGPVPADSVFHQGLQGRFDGIVSLYHDQGHIATKTYDFDNTVSVTVGLPILRASVDHGTAFDIAGTGQASPATMRSAILTAVKFADYNDRMKAQYGASPNVN